jgi:adenylate cyclase
VNISSRVEGLTKEYGVEIVVSDTTAQAAKGMAFLELDSIRVKGRRGVTTLFALDATERDAEFDRLVAAHGAMLAAYRAGRKDEAALALERAEPAYGRRYVGLYRLYRTRIADMPEVVPEGWDGVTTLDHK